MKARLEFPEVVPAAVTGASADRVGSSLPKGVSVAIIERQDGPDAVMVSVDSGFRDILLDVQRAVVKCLLRRMRNRGVDLNEADATDRLILLMNGDMSQERTSDPARWAANQGPITVWLNGQEDVVDPDSYW